ncbi:alpha/beta-hydrolase [Macrophomina phaseolina]|uniref:Alpha/beta-hydrolase n=1 Tax=Macrophomina phaseolina TaxID=35725 RepID=A0ABQ8GLM3_9PEZI|nr:alpha/beta-hydrolase [Macrophomina phaseolina]
MDPIYQGFELLTAYYKTVDLTPINVDILVPQNLTAGCYPTIARFHGGGFTSGSSLHTGFFPRWVLDLALSVGAIIISSNYRLLPESNAIDILEDLDDLWKWLTPNLNELLKLCAASGIEADLNRILTVGESAGGYLSVQFALDHAHEGVVATIAECAAFDIRAMAAAGGNQTTAINSSSIGVEKRSDCSNTPVIADPTLSRFGIISEIIQSGKMLDYFPDEVERVHPFDRVANGTRMPPTFLIHGLDDTVVPSAQSERFAQLLFEQNPDASVHLELQPGEHLMDVPLRLGHPWLTRGVELVESAWLGRAAVSGMSSSEGHSC